MNWLGYDWQPLWLALRLAATTTLILMLLGIPLAYRLAFSPSRLKPLWEALVSMPLVLPPSVLGFYLLLAFSPQHAFGLWLEHWLHLKLVFSFAGLVLGSVIFSLPFMVHPVQVIEAREAGAAAILIIVRALEDDEIKSLFAAARTAGLDALFEVHAEPEIDRAVAHGAKIIGVNNRDLAVFKTDLGLSERLIPLLPRDVIAVSESGIVTRADAARARAAGAHAVLVGEALMRANDPAALIAEFRGG